MFTVNCNISWKLDFDFLIFLCISSCSWYRDRKSQISNYQPPSWEIIHLINKHPFVRLSVHPIVMCALQFELFILNFGAKEYHNQSEEITRVSVISVGSSYADNVT